MKKPVIVVITICCVIVAMLLASCGYSHDETDLAAEDDFAAELVFETDDTSADVYVPQRTRFTGSVADHTFLWPPGRDQNWEADVIHFADAMLRNHPHFVEATTLFTVQDILDLRTLPTATVNFYNMITRLGFLTRVNALIDSIPNLADDEIIAALSAVVMPTGSRCVRVIAVQDVARANRITSVSELVRPVNYWFEYCAEYSLLHVTLLSCNGLGDFSSWDFMQGLLNRIYDSGGVNALVLDLRGHRGASILGNFTFFANWLRHSDNSELAGDFYIAVDGYTNSLGMAYVALFQAVTDTTIIGATPNAYVNFFGGRSYLTILPNSNTRVAIPREFFNMMPHMGFEVLTPHIFVDNSDVTYPEYDGILEYIRNSLRDSKY